MPDALPYNAPQQVSPIDTLSSILGIKQRQQALQTGAIQQQTAQAQSQSAQIATQGQQEAQAFFKQWDPAQHRSPDGTVDIDDALQNPIYKASGAGKPAITEQLLNIKKMQLGTKQDLAALNDDVFGRFTKGINALSSDKDVKADTMEGRQKVQDFVNAFSQEGPDAARIASNMQPIVSHAQPNRLQEALRSIGMMAQDVSGQQGQQNPQVISQDTGPAVQYGTVDKPTGAVTFNGPTLNKAPAPQLGTSTGGQNAVVSGAGVRVLPQVGASTQPATSAPRSAQDDAPGANAPRAAQEAYAAATQHANEHVNSVRTADEGYGNNKAISAAVRRLAGSAATGPGTETWNHVMGVLGTPEANNYQELGAFLDRQAATVRGQMGLPGTNAGAEDAKMIAGNTSYNAKVIQDKNDYTEALTDGLHMYRNGLDRIAGFSGQASPSEVAKFKSAWTNVFDPNVLIGENAYKRSKAEGDRFLSTLSPKEAASLAAKRKAMQDLAQGKLQ